MLLCHLEWWFHVGAHLGTLRAGMMHCSKVPQYCSASFVQYAVSLASMWYLCTTKRNGAILCITDPVHVSEPCAGLAVLRNAPCCRHCAEEPHVHSGFVVYDS